jgi:hypothetical protein
VLPVMLVVLSADPLPPAALAPDTAEPAEPRSTSLIVGAEAFGEFFPSSSQVVPNAMSRRQQSVLTGPRITLGYSHADTFRGFLVLEGGYAAAGLKAGNGDDGAMLGVGAEGDYVAHKWLMPFVRLTGDFRVAQSAQLASGTLTDRALVFSMGVRALRFLDVHFCMGSDFAGGFAVGFGAGLGWQWEIGV